ncbi:hypothetical protein BGW80DRAFT_1263540 [Lactifluus volemus]|nr:hypothetical protein BGW80DRAFT_1263540 [Lactifluus volemus]
MHAPSPTPSFPGAWPDWCSTDIPPPSQKNTSPSLLCLSPRPLPELPSLSSSLSTAESTLTQDSPTLPEPPCPPEETLPACTSPSIHSPVVILDLREPRTPDSAQFSLANNSITFPSPASSQLRLSLSNNCPGARSTETVDTYLPSPSSPRTPDAAELPAIGQDEESRPNLSGEEDTTADPWPRSNSQEHSPHAAAKVPMGKRTFLSRVKRIGSRVRKLFKARGVESKPRRNSASFLVSPRKPPLPVSVRLPAAVPESPPSHQGIELPHPISRRFSLQSLLHSRLPRESADSSSGAMASNRLSTIISAHEVEEGDWSSLDNFRLPDIADADRDGNKTEGETPMTSQPSCGLGIGLADPISVANPDST